MYQIVTEQGIRSCRKPEFVKNQKNGVPVACGPEEADGIILDGEILALRGRGFGGRETVDLVETGGTEPEEQNAANIDYLSMMTGVELPGQGGV